MCTAVFLPGSPHLFGRTLDLELSYNESVTVIPRRYPLSFRMTGTAEVHYAILGITADEARFHPKKHFITRALGVMSIIDLDYCEFPLEEGEAIIICTDGLSNYFSNEQLFEMIKSAGYSKCVDKLINAAKKEGGADNITVVCITR